MRARDPELAARTAEMSARRDPVTGRLLRYKRYADRLLLVMVGGDQHEPDLVWMPYEQLAERNRKRDWVSLKMTKRFGREPGLEQRCWYTGTQLYLVPYELSRRLRYHVPWECSREHLVCERNGGVGNGLSNIAIAGRAINDQLGHSPLPLKLLHRQVFAAKNFDRDTPTWEAVRPWYESIIEVEERYLLDGHYPWQPWAYEPGTRGRRIAEAFHAEMRAAEREFLMLDDEARRQWIDDFVWRW